MTEVHRIHSKLNFKDDTILPHSRWLKFIGSVLNQSSRMIQSCHLLDDRSSPDPFWTEVQGWYNPATFSMTEVHRIHSEPKSKDDTILPPSRWPKVTGSILNWSPRMIQSCHLLNDRSSPDSSWTEVQGWYNPTTFSMTKITGSLLDICPEMIQSLFILEDRGLWVTFG